MLYRRLLSYLRVIKRRPEGGPDNVSSAAIAQALGMGEVQVRKDLASASRGGRPKIGYITRELIADIERFLGYDNRSEAVLVGAGNLGRALMSYGNFEGYGLKIAAAFDVSPALVGTAFKDVPILDAAKIPDLCRRLGIRVGILTVPADSAQEACDALVSGGVLAVWNFAPVNLSVPDSVVLRNEDMGASLALLMRSLREKTGESSEAPRPARA
jgi:redox-sensing transcriptional repressor